MTPFLQNVATFENEDMKLALTFFNESGGVENMLSEIEKVIALFPEYTNKKWIFLDVMRTAYCNGYVGEIMENVAANFYLSDKELIKLVDFLGNEAFTFGWKDNLKNNYEVNEYTKVLEKFLEDISKVDLSTIIGKPDANSCCGKCPTNCDLINSLEDLNNDESCVPCPNSSGFNLCNQPYALCTSAKCVASKEDPDVVVCYCDVLKGCSLGTVPCDTLKPFKFKGLTILFSTFNPEQLATQCNTAQTYPNSSNSTTEFANCLNQICIVDPNNKKKAFCFCPTATSDVWTTVGNEINTDPNIILSGASQESFQETADFFLECKNITI